MKLTIGKTSVTGIPIGDDMRHLGLESDDIIVATVWNHHNSNECDGHAAFIVRAVNAHEGLVEVLRKCERMAELWVKTAVADRNITQLQSAKAHLDEIQAAIAKAEGIHA